MVVEEGDCGQGAGVAVLVELVVSVGSQVDEEEDGVGVRSGVGVGVGVGVGASVPAEHRDGQDGVQDTVGGGSGRPALHALLLPPLLRLPHLMMNNKRIRALSSTPSQSS